MLFAFFFVYRRLALYDIALGKPVAQVYVRTAFGTERAVFGIIGQLAANRAFVDFYHFGRRGGVCRLSGRFFTVHLTAPRVRCRRRSDILPKTAPASSGVCGGG